MVIYDGLEQVQLELVEVRTELVVALRRSKIGLAELAQVTVGTLGKRNRYCRQLPLVVEEYRHRPFWFHAHNLLRIVVLQPDKKLAEVQFLFLDMVVVG